MGFNASLLTEKTVKNFVDRLHKQNITHTPSYKRSQTQENVAVMFGYKNWHALQQAMVSPAIRLDISAPSCQIVHGLENERHDFYSELLTGTAPILMIHGDLSVPIQHWNAPCFTTTNDLKGHVLSHLDFDRMSSSSMYETVVPFLSGSSSETLDFIKNLLDMLTLIRDDPQCQHKFNADVVVKYFDFGTFKAHASRRDIPLKSVEWVQQHLEKFGVSPYSCLSVNEAFLKHSHYNEVHKRICSPLWSLFGSTPHPAHASCQSVQVMAEQVDDKILSQYIQWWSRTHPEGIVISDGLESDSHLYMFFLRWMAQRNNTPPALILGSVNAYDFPSLQIYEQIKARMQNVSHLS